MSAFSKKIFQNIDNNISKESHDINQSTTSRASQFLIKLYQILEDKNNENVIHWGNDGKYFIIENMYDFIEKILPKYYNHKNYASFVRQLNKYNFHKLKTLGNENAFQNNLFIKGQKELISRIFRKKKTKRNGVSLGPENITSLVKYKKNNFLYDINNLSGNYENKNNYSLDKHSLSLDEDNDNTNSLNSFINKDKSVNSLFGYNSNNTFIPYAKNEINMNQFNLKQNLMNQSTDNKINKKQKISKINVFDLLNDIINKSNKNSTKQKKLNAKIDSLSSKNMEYLNNNKDLLNKIESTVDYKNKFEQVISFIQEIINIKNLGKNRALPDNSNNFHKSESSDSDLNNLEIINSAKMPDDGNISNKSKDILSEKSINNEHESFNSFLNKYVEKNKNKNLLLMNSEYNNNNNPSQLINNDINLKQNNNKNNNNTFLQKSSVSVNSDNMSYINDPFFKDKTNNEGKNNFMDNNSIFKRNRSNSFFSSYSNDNNLFSNDYNINNRSEINWNNNINSNNININKSFDGDFNPDKNSYRKDSLNNSSYSFIDIPNKNDISYSSFK